MRTWIDVYDAAGNRLGDGPVTTCQSASVKRRLDGAGSLALNFPLTDKRAESLMQPEHRVRIFVESDDAVREIGRGVIRESSRSATANGYTLSVDGPDSLDALTRRSVRGGREYTNQTIQNIASDLVSLVPGWSVTVEPEVASQLQTARFTGTSVMKTMLRLAEEKGLHLREGIEANTVEIGVFGAQAEILVTNLANLSAEIYSRDELIFIDRLTVSESSQAVANWIIGYGAGEGQAALTLKNSTRTSPYPINTLVENGQTIYYLKDDASIAANDQIEKVVTFKSIGPIANSTLAKELAADALYDAMAAWLQHNSQRLTTYMVRGLKPRQTVRPGDKIRIRYQGDVYRDGEVVTFLDVDDWFWVMSVTEQVSNNGISIDLEVATIDKHMEDAAQIIVGALEDIQVRNVAVQTFPYWSENTYTDFVGWNRSNFTKRNAKFKLKISNHVTDIISVVIQFKTRPLFTQSLIAPPNLTPWSIVYELIEGNQHPKGIMLKVNNIDVSSNFGGPWNNRISGTPGFGWNIGEYENNVLDIECDITELILNATGGIYQDHSIEFEVGADGNAWSYIVPGQGATSTFVGDATSGIIELNIRVLGVAQAIIPT